MKRRAWTREEASRELASLDASWYRALEAQRARRALDGAGSPLVDQATTAHPQPTPPAAATLPVTVITHDFVRQDNYSWLRDEYRTDPDVLEYLKVRDDAPGPQQAKRLFLAVSCGVVHYIHCHTTQAQYFLCPHALCRQRQNTMATL